MLGQGMSPEDLIKLMNVTELDCVTFEKIKNGEDFVLAADRLGDEAYEYAENQASQGYNTSASQYYFNACALYRLADYGLVDITKEKIAIYKKIPNSFRKAKALSVREKVVNVEIPYGNSMLPGYLIIPEGAKTDVPVVIYIPGATGYKEENYLHAFKLREGGMAVIIFDGPSQDEALHLRDIYYTVDNYEKAVKAVIDFIHAESRLRNRIVLMGVSYGGYLATRAACFVNEYIEACVCRDGCAKTDDLTMPRNRYYLRKFMHKFNVNDESKAAAINHQMNIEPYLKNITCPILVQHTYEDPILGIDDAQKIYDLVSSKEKEYYRIPGNVHCECNENEKVGGYGADWVMGKLFRK